MVHKKDIAETSMDMFHHFKNNLQASGLYLFSGENLRTQQAKAQEGKGGMLELLVKEREGIRQNRPVIYNIILVPEIKPHTYDFLKKKMVSNLEKKRFSIIVLNKDDKKAFNRLGVRGFALQEKGELSPSYSTETLYSIIQLQVIEKFLSTPINLGGHEGRLMQYYQAPKKILQEGLRSYFLTPVKGAFSVNKAHKFAKEMDLETGSYIQEENKRNQYVLTGTPLQLEPIPVQGQKLVGKIMPFAQ